MDVLSYFHLRLLSSYYFREEGKVMKEFEYRHFRLRYLVLFIRVL